MKTLEGNIKLNNLWSEYNAVRLSGNKKVANQLLNTFILNLKKQDEETINTFVTEICNHSLCDPRVMSNNGKEVSSSIVRIQHPLFKEVILPVLAQNFRSRSSQHIRWIAQFEQFFYSDDPATREFLREIDVAYPFDTIFFLEKSYEIQNDQFTLNLLLNKLAQELDYAIHEVPIGVLWEPRVFDREVDKFRKYLDQVDDKQEWLTSFKEWTTIGEKWRTYSTDKTKNKNFEHYLDIHK